MHLAAAAREVEQRRERVAAVERHPHQVPQLRQTDHDRRGRGEAAHHRVRQEVDQDAAAQQPEGELDPAHEKRQRRRQGDVVRTAGLRQAVDGLEGQERHDRHRAHRQRPRRAHQRVGEQRQRGGDQAGHRGHPRQQRVRHPLGHDHHGDRQPGDHVRAEVGATVASQPGRRRERERPARGQAPTGAERRAARHPSYDPASSRTSSKPSVRSAAAATAARMPVWQ